jgi:hypothetical protein
VRKNCQYCCLGVLVFFFSLNALSVERTESSAPCYHAFQNYDDDVDRIKTYSNLFGGNSSIVHGDPLNPQIRIQRDTVDTRTGYGRSLRIDFRPMTSWSMIVESFNCKWDPNAMFFDLSILFPDYDDTIYIHKGLCHFYLDIYL